MSTAAFSLSAASILSTLHYYFLYINCISLPYPFYMCGGNLEWLPHLFLMLAKLALPYLLGMFSTQCSIERSYQNIEVTGALKEKLSLHLLLLAYRLRLEASAQVTWPPSTPHVTFDPQPRNFDGY